MKLYDLIYADPPWRYQHNRRKIDNIDENHYQTMELEDICKMEIPAKKDCVLLLWCTQPKYEEGIKVINAWGFTIKSMAIWVKDKIGLGYYFRNQHEFILLATKGKPIIPKKKISQCFLFSSKRTQQQAQ